MKWSLLLWLGLTSAHVNAQTYLLRVQHLAMEKGLPNDYISGIAEDQDGFMWIATNYGYCRYDGYWTHTYAQQIYPGMSTAHYNSVRSIWQDAVGRLWIIYNAQLSWGANPSRIVEILELRSKKIVSFDEAFAGIAPFNMSEIVWVHGYADTYLWIVTAQRVVYVYDGHFNRVGVLPATLTNESLYNIRISANCETLWLADNKQRRLYELQTDGQLRSYALSDQVSLAYNATVNQLNITPAGRLEVWYKKPGKPIVVYPLNSAELLPFNGYDEMALALTDAKNQLWYIRSDHVFIFDSAGNLLTTTAKGNKKERSPFYKIYSARFNRAGQCWLQTNHGVFILSLYKSPFKTYLTQYGIQDIRGIIAAEIGKIFVNQQDIFQIEPQEQRLTYDEKALVGSIRVGDTIWSGTYDRVVYCYIPRERMLRKVSGDITRLSVNAFTVLPYQSKKTRRIWIGGYLFLGYLNAARDSILLFEDYGHFPHLKYRSINFFYENREGLWLCTDNGVYLLDEARGIIAHYAAFPYNYITHLHEDNEGTFWLATRGGGLLRWNRQKRQVRQFTIRDGLSNNVLYAVYEDDYQHLWLPSNYGLMRFHKTTHEIRTYLPQDGLPHHEFNLTSHARTPDGRFFFGGLGGVVSFHPKDLLENDKVYAPLRLTSLKKLNSSTGAFENYSAEWFTQSPIVLRPSQRSVQLEFALLNYAPPGQNRYSYRLEGLQNEWIYLSSNSLYISGLPYGKYTLHLRAQALGESDTKEALSIPILVLRPFYRKNWFIAFMLLSGVILVTVIFRLRTRQLRQDRKRLETEVRRRTATIEAQAAELRALNEQRSRFFISMAHDLRTPLTFLMAPISVFLMDTTLDNRLKELLQSLQRHAKYLLEMLESFLEVSRSDRRPLLLQETPVQVAEMVDSVFSIYESYARLHQIDYVLEYEANTDLCLLLDRGKVEKILHNLLSNALKYNVKNGKVRLIVRELPEMLSIEVKDTGIGIHPDDLPHIFEPYYQSQQEDTPPHDGYGIGLAIAAEYAQLMGGTLRVQSTPGKGSVFMLSIPKKIVPNGASLTKASNKDEVTPLDVTPSYSIEKNGKRPTTRPRLLLVEDNAEMQELLRQITASEYEVLQAPDGQVALEFLRQQSVDCIITDLMMPRMDGFALIEVLKQSPDWSFMPVIVLTARANEQDKLKALRLGIDDYLNKPFLPAELLARVQNLTLNYEKRRSVRKLLAPDQEAPPTADQRWLQNLENQALLLFRNHPDFTLLDLADAVNLSERHLRRKLREITGLSANEYLREIRLQKARQFLEQRIFNTVAEVSYAVGFSSPGHFTKVFTERFGRKPSEYL